MHSTFSNNLEAYDDESASASVLILSFFSFLTGMGSCAAFQAALKTGKTFRFTLAELF